MLKLVLASWLCVGARAWISARPSLVTTRRCAAAAATLPEEVDVIVIGSGIGGLSAAAVLASRGLQVAVFEAHDRAGGAAHEFDVAKGYRFESGPSLYAGLSPDRSPNPLKHVFQIIEEEPEWITYDRWGTAFPEGTYAAAVGASDFVGRILPTYGGPGAVEQWERLMRRVEPLGAAIFGLPAAAVREDAWAALTLGRYAPKLFEVIARGGPSLSRPFSELLDAEGITNTYIRRWLDMICFLLQGATTSEAPTTLMAYMLSDFYRDGVCLDFPRGGTGAIVDALQRGLEKKGGTLHLKAPVEQIVEEGGRAAGVRVGGRFVRARQAVVSNADLWATRRLVGPGPVAKYLDAETARVTRCESFLHLHVGIDASGLPQEASEAFPAQWASLEDWDRGVDAPRNLVLVSVASMLDDSLAPPGKHVIHAYTPATEPYSEWEKFEGEEGQAYQSAEYRAAKKEATDVLWRAIEKYIPDARRRAEVTLEGTPLTHKRFLRRDRGTYGAFVPASSGEQLMGHKTPLDGLLLCGDSTFPGIGMPAVAASGLITACSILGVRDHWAILDKIRS